MAKEATRFVGALTDAVRVPIEEYEVRAAILGQIEQVRDEADPVWDPPWSPRMISKDGRRQLGWR